MMQSITPSKTRGGGLEAGIVLIGFRLVDFFDFQWQSCVRKFLF
jgi:hypothetical protein